MPTISFRHILVALICIGHIALAQAGPVYFNLTRSDQKLTVTNLGSGSAFYPMALRLLADGQWETLPPLHGGKPPAELPGGAQTEFYWRPMPSGPSVQALAALQPVMMRFYNQDGVAFGQISFFNQPPPASSPLLAEYRHGRLTIQPPSEARVTWLLWGQEEGITPLRQAGTFQHRQPPAKRIAWPAGGAAQSFDLGAGQPSAMLLHETPQGLELQILASGGLAGREQRTAWLGATFELLGAALVFCLAAGGTLLWHWRRQRNGRLA